MTWLFGIDLPSLSTADRAQVISAMFTALAALAAWATVLRLGRERRRSSWPDLHVEAIVDKPHQEVRLTILNYGGPAREVALWGVMGDFGFGGSTEPSTFWQPGERRTFHLHVPPVPIGETQIMVEGRDMAKGYVFTTTVGGAKYRWRHRRFRKTSTAKTWARLFPTTPLPIDAKHAPMRVELIDREVGGRRVGPP